MFDTTHAPVQILKFGTKNLPYPTKAEGKAANPHSFFGMPELAGIEEERPLILPTHHRNIGAALGQLYRDLPPYNLLDIQLDMINAFHPMAARKVVTVFGDKGASKTHTMLNLAKVVHPKGGVLIEMGGKNFRSLFEDFGIDTQQQKAFSDQFGDAERRGELDQATIHFVETKYKDTAKKPDGSDLSQSLTEKVYYVLSHLENGHLKDFIESVQKIQGWGSQNTGLNFKSRPGMIWDAILEERPLVIDEIDKAEKGSIATINTFWQFLTAPETISEYEFVFENGEKRVIRRTSDLTISPGPHWDEEKQVDVYYMKPTCTVLMAGNYANDGAASNDLPSSVYDRLKPKYVSAPVAADFSCVWSGKLYGINLPVLYEMHQNTAKNDIDRFTRLVDLIRDLGLAPNQQNRRHESMPWAAAALDPSKFNDTILGLKKLGKVIEFRRDILDEDSDLRKPGQATGNLQNLSTEGVTASFAKKFPQTYRTIKDIFEQSVGFMPNLTPADDIAGILDISEDRLVALATGDVQAVADFLDMKDVGSQLGSRITEMLETTRALLSRDKPTLAGVLQDKEKEFGVVADSSGTLTGSLPHLLNIDPASMLKFSPEAKKVQKEIHSQMTALLGVDGNGHAIIGNNMNMVVPAKPIQESLAVIRAEASALDIMQWPSAHEREMILPRLTRGLKISEFKASPLYRYHVTDILAATGDLQSRVGQPRKPIQERRQDASIAEDKAVKTERATLASVVLGLTLPVLKEYNLSTIWTPGIEGKVGGDTEKNVAPLLSGKEENGYCYTCFAVSNPFMGAQVSRGGDSAERGALDTLHLIFNRRRPDNFLFIGGTVPESLKEYMGDNRVDYIERWNGNDSDNILSRKKEIDQILADKFELSSRDDAPALAKKILKSLFQAVQLRNKIDTDYSTLQIGENSLSGLVLSPNLKFSKPLMVTAQHSKPLLER